jgi:hypothetical protein
VNTGQAPGSELDDSGDDNSARPAQCGAESSGRSKTGDKDCARLGGIIVYLRVPGDSLSGMRANSAGAREGDQGRIVHLGIGVLGRCVEH